MTFQQLHRIPDLTIALTNLNLAITHGTDEECLHAVSLYIANAEANGMITPVAIALRDGLIRNINEQTASTAPATTPKVSTSPK
jgi:hypothetical protein